jgi:hypothetical protein
VDWHAQAACSGESDERLWIQEPPGAKLPPHLGSATMLLPLVICSGCPVRRPCLESALTAPVYNVRADDALTAPRTIGVWGGTHELDRHAVHVLEVELAEQIELLEATLAARIAIRTEAWRDSLRSRRSGRRAVSKRDLRLEQLLGPVAPMKRFHLQRPGPGRGHLGPIAIYAAAHGVSRSTAWRRLKVSAARPGQGPVPIAMRH